MSELDVHVVPCNDEGETDHASESTCPCQPRVNHEDPVTGARVYVHHRLADEPLIEQRPLLQ